CGGNGERLLGCRRRRSAAAMPADRRLGRSEESTVGTSNERSPGVEGIRFAARIVVQVGEDEDPDPAEKKPIEPAHPALLGSEPPREDERAGPEENEEEELFTPHVPKRRPVWGFLLEPSRSPG